MGEYSETPSRETSTGAISGSVGTFGPDRGCMPSTVSRTHELEARG